MYQDTKKISPLYRNSWVYYIMEKKKGAKTIFVCSLNEFNIGCWVLNSNEVMRFAPLHSFKDLGLYKIFPIRFWTNFDQNQLRILFGCCLKCSIAKWKENKFSIQTLRKFHWNAAVEFLPKETGFPCFIWLL